MTMIEDPRRNANPEERRRARDIAIATAREAARAGANRSAIANQATEATIASVDARLVKPSSLSDIATAAHHAAYQAARACEADPTLTRDQIAARVSDAVADAIDKIGG